LPSAYIQFFFVVNFLSLANENGLIYVDGKFGSDTLTEYQGNAGG